MCFFTRKNNNFIRLLGTLKPFKKTIENLREYLFIVWNERSFSIFEKTESYGWIYFLRQPRCKTRFGLSRLRPFFIFGGFDPRVFLQTMEKSSVVSHRFYTGSHLDLDLGCIHTPYRNFLMGRTAHSSHYFHYGSLQACYSW